MDLKALNDMPPWEWPAGTGEALRGVLMDDQASESDREQQDRFIFLDDGQI